MKHFRLLLLVLGTLTGTLKANSIKVIGFIDANQCSSCNSISAALKKYPAVLRSMHFVFSAEEATIEQGREFIAQMLNIEANVALDTKLVNRLRLQFKGSKVPQVLLYDTLTTEIRYSMPMDSIAFRIDLFRNFIQQQETYTYRVIDNPRISKLIGWKNIGVIDNKIFVTPFQGANKIYFLDLASNRLDSIALDDAALQKVYEHLGKTAKVNEVRKYHQAHNIPMPLFKFSSDSYVDDSLFYSYLEIYYYDPANQSDTIMPEGNLVLVSYNPATRQLKLNKTTTIEINLDNDSGKDQPAYLSDFTVKYRLNDSTWIASCDKIERGKDTTNKTKLFYSYRMDANKHLTLNGLYDSVTLTNMRTFGGKHFNDIHTYNAYGLVYPILFYAQSIQVYDLQFRKQVSLNTQLAGVNWIFDMNVSPSTITILYQQQDGSICLAMLNRHTYELLSNRKIFNPKLSLADNHFTAADARDKDVELKYMSNLKLVNNRIIYINKAGKIIEIFPH